MKANEKAKAERRGRTRDRITKEFIAEYYGEELILGVAYPLQTAQSPVRQVIVLAVSMTHVYVKFEKSGLRDNIPHRIFKEWLDRGRCAVSEGQEAE